MLNDVLLSFFFGMPAIVAVAKSREMTNPLSRQMLFWGGWVAIVLVAIVTVPMVACDGHLMKPYKTCLIGGDGLAQLFTSAQPAILLAAKAYILVGVPLGVLAFALEWTRPRGKAGAS